MTTKLEDLRNLREPWAIREELGKEAQRVEEQAWKCVSSVPGYLFKLLELACELRDSERKEREYRAANGARFDSALRNQCVDALPPKFENWVTFDPGEGLKEPEPWRSRLETWAKAHGIQHFIEVSPNRTMVRLSYTSEASGYVLETYGIDGPAKAVEVAINDWVDSGLPV